MIPPISASALSLLTLELIALLLIPCRPPIVIRCGYSLLGPLRRTVFFVSPLGLSYSGIFIRSLAVSCLPFFTVPAFSTSRLARGRVSLEAFFIVLLPSASLSSPPPLPLREKSCQFLSSIFLSLMFCRNRFFLSASFRSGGRFKRRSRPLHKRPRPDE